MNERQRERDLDWVAVPTIGDLLVRGAARWPDRLAVAFPDERATYAELLEGSIEYALGLLALGVRPRDDVAIMMPNCLDHLRAQFGCALLGAGVVMVNGRYKRDELNWVLTDSGVRTILTSDLNADFVDFAGLITDAAHGTSLERRVMIGDSAPDGFVSHREFLELAGTQDAADVHGLRRAVVVRDPAIMMYTSGTTSRPAGCWQTHDALVRTAMAASERWRLEEGQASWVPLPLFHIGGVFPTLAHLWAGGTLVMQHHFEAGEALSLIEEHGCHGIFPQFITITQALLEHEAFGDTDLSSVSVVHHNGDEEMLASVQRSFPGAAVVSAYGMTETCGSVAWGDPADPPEKRLTSSGRPVRGARVRLLDENGVEVAAGEVGEITLRSAGLFGGYFNNPDKTAESLVDGWLHTGDLGVVDKDGYLTYVGRAKQMLKVGGENVAPAEIESFICRHPAVRICQVVGVPDRKYREVAAAFVELSPGERTDAEELRAFMDGQIASFKVPRYFEFVDEWPMSATKIRKDVLRDRLVERLGL